MGRAPRVLVLDDDPVTLGIIHAELALEGFEVTTSRDPAPVLTPALRGRYDLVLTELVMNSMTGLEFVRFLREQGIEVPAVLVTASLHGGVIEGAEKLGFTHVVPKPFKEHTVGRVARKALAKAKGDTAVTS